MLKNSFKIEKFSKFKYLNFSFSNFYFNKTESKLTKVKRNGQVSSIRHNNQG